MRVNFQASTPKRQEGERTNADILEGLAHANCSIKGKELMGLLRKAGVVHVRTNGSKAVFKNPDTGAMASVHASLNREHSITYIRNIAKALLSEQA